MDGDHYMNQEGVYVHRLKTKMVSDDERSERHKVGEVQGANLSDDEGADPPTGGEIVLSIDNSGYDERTYKERTEWQTMLSSVLTGEVFQAEKSRLNVQGPDSKPILMLWTELKAKVACRSLSEQRRMLAVGRGHTHEVLDRITNFKPLPPPATIAFAYAEISSLLTLLERCESLWPNLQAMQNYFPMYGSMEFRQRCEALTAYLTVVKSVFDELELLRKWTNNAEADPTLAPNAESESLVSTLQKQEGALKRIFENHIERYLFPLVARARECVRTYQHEFDHLNLPSIDEILKPLISFSVKLVQQSMELRLAVAAKMYNPNTMMIDEVVNRFEMYLSLGLKLAQNCLRLGEVVQKTSLNETMLRSIRFYLDLLSNKFLDGGSSSMSFFRSFKNIEQLDGHFSFLQVTCQLIDGGDISVAEQFCSLHLRILSRLLAYWEHQMEGPRHKRKRDIDRWFADTCENIRSIHRKLMRFYKTLCNTYENAAVFRPRSETGVNTAKVVEQLAELGFVLLVPNSNNFAGTYSFASPSLAEQPLVIKSLLQGHTRPPLEDEDPSAIIQVSVGEKIAWGGGVVKLERGCPYPLLEFKKQVRIIAQGGYPELQQFQKLYPSLFDELLVRTVQRQSQLPKVEAELLRMRAVWLRLMLAVLQSAIRFRRHIREEHPECMETVQIMMAFAHDFGERSLRLIPEVSRGKVVLKMFEFCLEWLDFVVDDCPPGDSKKFKWTVMALEFAMKMTRGVNVLALPEDKFSRLRSKVADCMAILIAHYDIMGARSKAANLTNHNNRVRLQQQAQIRGASQQQQQQLMNEYEHGDSPSLTVGPLGGITPVSPAANLASLNTGNNPSASAAAALKDDDEVIAAHRVTALEKFEQLDARMTSPATHGKILDQNNTEFEFLSFASSPFTAAAMRWQRAEQIGSGSFGSVFKAHSLDDFQVMAVKEMRISLTQSISKVLKSIKDEMNVLEIVSHPNIVQYYGVEVHRERVYIFMEYCPQGSLAEMLQYGQIDDEMIVQFFSLQILEGLAYLHDIGIVHRDIKPANILLKNNFIKIVDFGAAKIIANNGNLTTQTQTDATKGTPMYMAPEVITREPSASLPSVDIWSLGCVMMQMVTGQLPWSDCDNIYSILYCIGNNRMPKIPDNDSINPDCRKLIVSCLQRDPSKRLSAMELLRNPWFDSARETLNQFLEMRDHELDIVDPPNSSASATNLTSVSQQALLSTQELLQQQQQQQQQQHQQHQQQQQQLLSQQTNQSQYQSQQNHDSMFTHELVSGYEQQAATTSDLHVPQITIMEPIVESDKEYEDNN